MFSKTIQSIIKAIARIASSLFVGLIVGTISGTLFGGLADLVLSIARGFSNVAPILSGFIGAALGITTGLTMGTLAHSANYKMSTIPKWALVTGLASGLGAVLWALRATLEYREEIAIWDFSPWIVWILIVIATGAVTGGFVARIPQALSNISNRQDRATAKVIPIYLLGFLSVTIAIYKIFEFIESVVD